LRISQGFRVTPENGDARKKVRPGRVRPGQPQPDKNKVMMEITMDKPRHGRRDSLSNSAARQMKAPSTAIRKMEKNGIA
jgi:hypothetical protein